MNPRPDPAATTPARINDRDRSAAAVRLRAEGHDYNEIAARLGYASANSANKSVLALLARTEHDAADALRNLEAARLDLLWAKLWQVIEDAGPNLSPALVAAAVRVSERRSRLLGLDTPQQAPAYVDTVPDVAELRAQFLAIIDV